MSNTMVGSVYQKIMDDVIDNCVVTFEEDGVERKLLDEVRKTWQAKLSERKVALMPWDPAQAPPSAPQPIAAANVAPSRPSQAPQPDQHNAKPTGAPQAGAPGNHPNGPSIKTEPGVGGYDLQSLGQTNGVAAAYSNTSAALDRTSQQLHEKFGAAAGPQISQLQARRAMMNQNTPQQAQASQSDLEAKRRMYEMQQAQRHKAQIANQQQQQQQQQRALGSAQTDGPSDWASLVTERRAAAAADGEQADYSLRELLEASSREMEGGGLLQPVTRTRSSAAYATRKHMYTNGPNQYDGPNDDDDDGDDSKENDEDAINSDLDDPEEELDQDDTDEDANQGEIMLCTYDKVQRVKNKWKCTLKDGVLTTGGKEYVFHKANGEFEW